jgi:NAD(P)-dependent dehydrogenase (short-subunit alcohol dehydrogenase family)
MNSPGAIETNGAIELVNEEQWKKMVENIVKSTPLRRIGEPLDIAKGIVFLSSIDAQFMTGANLVIDGGIMFG